MTGVFKNKIVLVKCNYMLKQLALEIRPDFMLVCEQELKLDFRTVSELHVNIMWSPCKHIKGHYSSH